MTEQKQFHEVVFSREGRYWFGIESASGRNYLGIPTSNAMVDYIEYYWIDAEQYQLFSNDPERAFEFAESCRRREHDALPLCNGREQIVALHGNFPISQQLSGASTALRRLPFCADGGMRVPANRLAQDGVLN